MESQRLVLIEADANRDSLNSEAHVEIRACVNNHVHVDNGGFVWIIKDLCG